MAQANLNRWKFNIAISLVILTCGGRFAAGAEGPQKPSHLRCEYLVDPVGIDVTEGPVSG